MRSFLYILSALSVIGLAYWAYNENYTTQDELKKVSDIRREIGKKREELGILRAEWAYLNRPERLRDLTDLNFTALELMPLAPQQFGDVLRVGFPRLDIKDVNGPVDVSAQDAGQKTEATK